MLFGLFSNNAGESDLVLFIIAKTDKQNTKTILYVLFFSFVYFIYCYLISRVLIISLTIIYLFIYLFFHLFIHSTKWSLSFNFYFLAVFFFTCFIFLFLPQTISPLHTVYIIISIFFLFYCIQLFTQICFSLFIFLFI